MLTNERKEQLVEVLVNFIDWDKMFNKAFHDKLDTIIKPLALDLNPYSSVINMWG